MTKQIIQLIYNFLRPNKLISNIVNFVKTREKNYNSYCKRLADHALNMTKRNNGDHYVTQAGIFEGMIWPEAVVVGSEFAPKVVGTYEVELQPVLFDLLKKEKFTSFLDIGAAEGYYAVGVCLVSSILNVVAFEIQTDAHSGLRKLADVNCVANRITLFGEFNLKDLDYDQLGERPLILIDIEGGEANLCNRFSKPPFRNAVIIIEIHDFVAGGTGLSIADCLTSTHSVEKIVYRPKLRGTLRPKAKFSAYEWMRVTDEARPRGNYWLVATPKVLQ